MYEYLAKLDRVVDGDTVDLVVDLGFSVFHKVRVRILGVNTPERGDAGWDEATSYTRAWFAAHSGVLLIRTVKDKDKYGRILAHIEADTIPVRSSFDSMDSLSEGLLNSGHGQPYYGGKRG